MKTDIITAISCVCTRPEPFRSALRLGRAAGAATIIARSHPSTPPCAAAHRAAPLGALAAAFGNRARAGEKRRPSCMNNAAVAIASPLSSATKHVATSTLGAGEAPRYERQHLRRLLTPAAGRYRAVQCGPSWRPAWTSSTHQTGTVFQSSKPIYTTSPNTSRSTTQWAITASERAWNRCRRRHAGTLRETPTIRAR